MILFGIPVKPVQTFSRLRPGKEPAHDHREGLALEPPMRFPIRMTNGGACFAIPFPEIYRHSRERRPPVK